jgi:hypothetical protein
MHKTLPIGWMKMGLRAQICSECSPVPVVADPWRMLAPHLCETRCALFIELPRLAQFLQHNHAKPPVDYQEFVLKLLGESSEGLCGPVLDYAPEALAILERVIALSDSPDPANPPQDRARKSPATGQMSVSPSKNDGSQPLKGH